MINSIFIPGVGWGGGGGGTGSVDATGPITITSGVSSITSQTGTGTKFVVDTSPTLVTPILGVAAATSINKVAITAPATSATLTLADGSTLATSGAYSGTLTLTGATNVTIPTTGTLATQAYVATQVAGLLDYKGGYNASTNTPDLDTSPSGILKGDMYTVTAAGTFYAVDLEIGDALIANIDNPIASTDWTILQKNLLSPLNADTITLADETSDTTCFPAFGTGATGSNALKTNSAFTFNSATGLLSATSIGGAWAGSTIGVDKGGTGATTFTAHGVLLGNTTGAIAVTGAGTAGQVLTSNGSSSDPTYQDSGASVVKQSIHQTSHGFSAGNALYYTGSAYALAKADATSTSSVVGIVLSATTDDFIMVTSGYMAFPGTLTAGAQYFLSASSAGAFTATDSFTAGQVRKPLFVTNSTNTGHVDIQLGVQVKGYLRYTGTSARGSTNTTVLRWDTAADNAGGSDLTFTDSATLGSYYTVNISGVYAVSMHLYQVSGGSTIYLGVGGSVVNISANTETEIRSAVTHGSGAVGHLAWTGYIASGSKVWLSSVQPPSNTYPLLNQFTIARVN